MHQNENFLRQSVNEVRGCVLSSLVKLIVLFRVSLSLSLSSPLDEHRGNFS